MILRVLSLLPCLLVVAHPLSALVNLYNPGGNLSAPSGTNGEPTDPGFSNVGSVNGSSGVYLQNGWVLTANHVGAGTFSVNGQNYAYNGVDSHRIGNTDLRLFRISGNPMLAPLKIATASPSVGDGVVMIGSGYLPESSPTRWYVDTDTDPWTWQETTFPEADTLVDGYKTTSTKQTSWGTNRVSGFDSYQNSGVFYTDLSVGSSTTDDEAQAVTHDSGGGIFIDSGSGWELAGTMVTVSLYSGQPNGARTAMLGNRTYAIDLSEHASEINGYLTSPVPEPAAFALIGGLLAALVTLRRTRGKA